MKTCLFLALALLGIGTHGAQVHLSKAGGADIPADDTWRMVISNRFSVAQDMRAGRYTLSVEVMGVAGDHFRPLRHHGIKASVVVH